MKNIPITQEISVLRPSGIISEVSTIVAIFLSVVAAFTLDPSLAVVPAGIPAVLVLTYLMHRGVSWRSTPKLALLGCSLVTAVQAIMLTTVVVPAVG